MEPVLAHRPLGRQVEARVLEFVFPTDTNHLGTIFGGTLVAWMDKAAAFAAIRRAHTTVVTASIDGIDFKVPIKQGDIAELVARVEGVGRTSLRVRVEVNREDPMDGSRELCTVGYFTMVALGADGRPKPVPPENEADQPHL
jgi:acyl-CoA hydrolase